MARPLSLDLRSRIAAALTEGATVTVSIRRTPTTPHQMSVRLNRNIYT
jgi:hypothetical protein